MAPRRIAVIGAGPIGLEAALEAARRGFEVRLYESGRVGEHLRRFDAVALFTPFGMNSSSEGRERLRSDGIALPSETALLTAGELVERYLVPLARLPELAHSIREGERVTHVAREGLGKGDGAGRAGRGFLLR
ncbi:MAG TPA: FAD-dependent oxidoreductase, partial [Candidatus Eisenbacteria bacterium]|nr:FAD-dependent oxidoreductase [Candidatus Eisenbacteria bacterium]